MNLKKKRLKNLRETILKSIITMPQEEIDLLLKRKFLKLMKKLSEKLSTDNPKKESLYSLLKTLESLLSKISTTKTTTK